MTRHFASFRSSCWRILLPARCEKFDFPIPGVRKGKGGLRVIYYFWRRGG